MAPSRYFGSLLVSLVMSSLALAILPNIMTGGKPSLAKIPVPSEPLVDCNGSTLPSINTTYYFDQFIDHNNPGLGTFRQRYWTTWQFYKPGGPIILMTPGEANADGFQGYLTNHSINGLIAQQQNGATVLIEHRFFGLSNPYDSLTSQSLEFLTIQQGIDDLVYFAQNVHLPMPFGDQVKPNQAPWILVGGSYSGALTGWTMVNKPGVFWAGYASSAVVQAINNFYGYFTPVQEHMPMNCSADVESVIAHLDESYTGNDKTALDSLKTAFGLKGLEHIDDLAAALRDNLFAWQSLQPYTGPGGLFYKFCDALEVKNGVSAGPEGWGLGHAITAWGTYWNTTYYTYVCGNDTAENCFGSYNPNDAYYTNTTIDNPNRSWLWMLCTQLGFSQNGPPEGQPAIISRILQPIYAERQCTYMFPQAFRTPSTPTTEETNKEYEGWSIQVDRLFFANGLRDPWREATVSADGLFKPSTSLQPIYEGDGFHTSDLITKSGKVDQSISKVQAAGLDYMKTWLASWVPHP